MSDIPMGSPPAPPGRHAAPGGWYPDPVDAAHERYWDGWQWSRNTREREGGAPPAAKIWGQPETPASPPANPYGAAQPNPYGQDPPQPNPYGQNPDVQPNPYGQNPYGQNPYGQNPPPGAYPARPGARPAVLTADGVPVASWGWRVLAAVVDGAVTGLVSLLLALPVLRPMFTTIQTWYAAALQAAQAGGTPPPTPSATDLISPSSQLVITLVSLAVGLTYHIVFVRRRGATPGKVLCGLKVVPVDQGRHTGPLEWNAVVLRAAIWVLPGAYGALFLIRVIDALLPLRHPKRQALHDLAAKTQVIRP